MLETEIIKQITDDLYKIGVNPDDTLMVHSSLKSLGWVEGGADTVIKAFMSYLKEGTLLMPALSYNLKKTANSRFSVLHTPGCVGTIPEAFRNYPDVIRSVHPTHSVCAYGKHAAEITARHYLDRTPVGENSPFRQLIKYNGKILMLGCGLEPNTFMHGVEEAVGTPYVLSSEPTVFLIEYADGNTEEASHITHNFKDVLQRYDRVEGILPIKRGKILNADSYLMDAAVLWDAAAKKIETEACFFVDNKT